MPLDTLNLDEDPYAQVSPALAPLEEADRRPFADSPPAPSSEPETQDAGLGLAQEAGPGAMETPDMGNATTGFPGAGGDAGTLSLNLGGGGGTSAIGRKPEDIQFLRDLPTAAKIGLMLEAFGAGVAGRPNPIDQLIVRKRLSDREHRQDLIATTTMLTKAMEEIRKFGPNTVRGQAVKNAHKKLLGPELGGTLDAIGTDRESDVASLAGLFRSPAVQKMAEQACSMSPNRHECWRKLATDDSWVKNARETRDNELMPALTEKFAKVKKAAEAGQLSEFTDEKGNFSYTQLVEGNNKHKLFTPDEMEAVRGNQSMFIRYGLVTDKSAQEGQSKAAKVAESKTPEPKIGQLRSIDIGNGATRQEEYQGLDEDGDPVWKQVGGKSARAPKAAKGEPGEKPLTAGQRATQERESANKEAALGRLKAAGIDPAKPATMGRLNKTLPNGDDNKTYVGDAQAAALKRDITTAGKVTGAEARAKRGGAFDPAGAGYDDARARAAGMTPSTEPGENRGHMGSVAPATPEERRKYGLPEESYVMLKGRAHQTWSKGVQGEEARGFKVVELGGRYYSVPKSWSGSRAGATPGEGSPTTGKTGAAPRGQLAPADQQKLMAAVNAKLAKGADPEAVKKWAKATYGLDLKIERRK